MAGVKSTGSRASPRTSANASGPSGKPCRTRRIGLQQEIIAAVAGVPWSRPGMSPAWRASSTGAWPRKWASSASRSGSSTTPASRLICSDLYQATPGTTRRGDTRRGLVQGRAGCAQGQQVRGCQRTVARSEDGRARRNLPQAPEHHALLDAVIRAADQAIGCICFEHVNTPHQWQPDEITFASQLCDQVAIALLNRNATRTKPRC